jgi:hypothetical protein
MFGISECRSSINGAWRKVFPVEAMMEFPNAWEIIDVNLLDDVQHFVNLVNAPRRIYIGLCAEERR